jgi:hypothetical protein
MKNIALLTLVIVTTVMLTLAFTAVAAPSTPAPPAAVFTTPVPTIVAPPDDPHPHIHAALEAMHHAKEELDSAAHDFHGHRVEAIKHLDAAIHEAEICEHER